MAEGRERERQLGHCDWVCDNYILLTVFTCAGQSPPQAIIEDQTLHPRAAPWRQWQDVSAVSALCQRVTNQKDNWQLSRQQLPARSRAGAGAGAGAGVAEAFKRAVSLVSASCLRHHLGFSRRPHTLSRHQVLLFSGYLSPLFLT